MITAGTLEDRQEQMHIAELERQKEERDVSRTDVPAVRSRSYWGV